MSARYFSLVVSIPDEIDYEVARCAIVATLEKAGFQGFDVSANYPEEVQAVDKPLPYKLETGGYGR